MPSLRYAAIVAFVIGCLGSADAAAEPLRQGAGEVFAPGQAKTTRARSQRGGHTHARHAHRHAASSRRARGGKEAKRDKDPIPDHANRHDAEHRHAGHGGHSNATVQGHGLETENLFGFTLGSDTEHAGARGVASETVGRFGKRDGSYSAIGKKLEFAYGVTDDISVALGLFAAYHRIHRVSGFDDVNAFNFNGVGGEVRWRLARRGPGGLGVTLHVEPSVQLVDELTGLRGTKLGAENKLIFDTELVKDRVFAAFNLLYELEHVREDGNPIPENGSKVGVAAALSTRVARNAFVGAELRYLRAYEGLVPTIFAGEAFYIGPTLFWQFAANAWIAAAWNVQVAGREVDNPARLDLVNFERHQGRLKLGVTF